MMGKLEREREMTDSEEQEMFNKMLDILFEHLGDGEEITNSPYNLGILERIGWAFLLTAREGKESLGVEAGQSKHN